MAWFRCGGADTSNLEEQINDLNSQLTNAQNTISGLNNQIAQKDQLIDSLQSSMPPLSPACGVFNSSDIKILQFKPDFVAIYGHENDKGCASIDDYINNFHQAVQSYDGNRAGPTRFVDINDRALAAPNHYHYAAGKNGQSNVKIGVSTTSSLTLPFSPNIIIGYWIDNTYLSYSILDLVSNYNEEVYGYNGDTHSTRFSVNGNVVNGFRSGITYFAAKL